MKKKKKYKASYAEEQRTLFYLASKNFERSIDIHQLRTILDTFYVVEEENEKKKEQAISDRTIEGAKDRSIDR